MLRQRKPFKRAENKFLFVTEQFEEPRKAYHIPKADIGFSDKEQALCVRENCLIAKYKITTNEFSKLNKTK